MFVLLLNLLLDTREAIKSFWYRDGVRFIRKNSSMTDQAHFQLYSSTLVFSSREIITRKVSLQIKRLLEVESAWSVEVQFLEDHSDGVDSVPRMITHMMAKHWHDVLEIGPSNSGILSQALGSFGSLNHSLSTHSWVLPPDSQLFASISKEETREIGTHSQVS